MHDKWAEGGKHGAALGFECDFVGKAKEKSFYGGEELIL